MLAPFCLAGAIVDFRSAAGAVTCAGKFREAADSAATAAVKDTEMAQSEDSNGRTTRIPANIIDTVNKVVRVSRQMFTELGREPTPEELAERLAMPLEKLRKVLEIAKRSIRLETWTSGEPDPCLG
jgi:hypothetical protein